MTGLRDNDSPFYVKLMTEPAAGAAVPRALERSLMDRMSSRLRR